MGMTYFGGDYNGRYYSTLEDNFDLYRRRTSGMPYYYIQGICDDECDPMEPEKAPEYGYHLVFRTADNKLVSAVRMPSDNPFGPYDEKEVFHLNGEPHRCDYCVLDAYRTKEVYEQNCATCAGCTFFEKVWKHILDANRL